MITLKAIQLTQRIKRGSLVKIRVKEFVQWFHATYQYVPTEILIKTHDVASVEPCGTMAWLRYGTHSLISIPTEFLTLVAQSE